MFILTKGQKTVVLAAMPGTHSVAFSTSRDLLPAVGLGGVVSEMTPALTVCDSVPRKVLICRIECLPFASLEQTSAHIQIPLPFHLTLKKGMSVKRCRKVQRNSLHLSPVPGAHPPNLCPKGLWGGTYRISLPSVTATGASRQGLALQAWPQGLE